MSKKTLVSHDAAVTKIESAMRLRVGLGKPHSYTSLAEVTGIPKRTLESYVQGATPGLNAFLSLCAALGPGFTSDVLSTCGQTARSGSDDMPEHLRVLTALGGLTAQIAEAVEDGHVDHQEAARLRQPARQLVDLLEPIASGEEPRPVPMSKRAG